MNYQNLFDTLHNLYDIKALESEMLEILVAVKKDEELYNRFLNWMEEENNKPRLSIPPSKKPISI